jgi:hypothetical protein
MTTATALRRKTGAPQEAPSAKPREHDARAAQPLTPALTQDQLLDLLDFTAPKHLGSL